MILRLLRLAGALPEDRRKLTLLIPVFLLCGISEMTGYNGYVTLFNERFGVEFLPYVYAAEAVILPLEAWFMSRLAGRLDKPRLMRAMFAIMGGIVAVNAAVLLGIRLGGGAARFYYPLLFLTSSFVVRQQTILLWSLAVDLCPTQQAKRLMPLFVSAAALGGIAAGLIAQGVGRLAGADAVYMLAPLFLLAGSFNYRKAISRYLVPLAAKAAAARASDGEAGGEAAEGGTFGRAFTSPYMLTAAGIMTLMPALYFLMEYAFLAVTRTFYPTEPEFASFFGLITTLLFVLAFMLQLVSGRISAWLGPSNMLAAIAAVFVLGFAAVAATLGAPAILYTMSLAYMLLYLLLYYFAEPANQLFFKLLPMAERDGYRYAVQGVSASAGILLGAGLQWLHAGLGLDLTALAWIGAGGAALLAALARLGRRLYMRELARALRDMTASGADMLGAVDEFLRRGRLGGVLAELLAHRDGHAREIGIELAARTGDSAHAPALLRLLGDPGARVRQAALHALRTLGGVDEAALAAAEPLLADADTAVRTEAVRLFGAAADLSGRHAAALRGALADADPQVVAEAVRALYARDDEVSREERTAVVERFLAAGGEPVVAVCGLIGQLGLDRYAPEVELLLGDPSPAVRVAATRCLGELGHAASLPWLLEQLEDADPVLREATIAALVRMGRALAELLLAALPAMALNVRSPVLRALAAIMDETGCGERLVPEAVRMLSELRAYRGFDAALAAGGEPGLAALAALRLAELTAFALDAAWAVMNRLADEDVALAVRTAAGDADEEVRESGLEALAEGLGDRRLAAALLICHSASAEAAAGGAAPGVSPLPAAGKAGGAGGPADGGQPGAPAAARARAAAAGFAAAGRDPWMMRIAGAAQQAKEEGRMADHAERQRLGLLDKLVFLKQVPFFSELTLDELGRVAGIAEEQVHAEGTRLFAQGAANRTLGVIVEGSLKIAAAVPGGGEVAVAVLRRKYVYGESSSLYGTLATASGYAEDGPLRILAIDGGELSDLIRLYPGIGIGVLRSAFDRVRRLEQTIAARAGGPSIS